MLQVIKWRSTLPRFAEPQNKAKAICATNFFGVLIYFVEPPHKIDYSQNFGVNTQQNHHAEYLLI